VRFGKRKGPAAGVGIVDKKKKKEEGKGERPRSE
jgi:hypothetical protein